MRLSKTNVRFNSVKARYDKLQQQYGENRETISVESMRKRSFFSSIYKSINFVESPDISIFSSFISVN